MRDRFDRAAFALRIRLAVARENLSYRAAAEHAEVDTATFHRVAKTAQPPTVENYLRILEWLESVEPKAESPQGK